MNDLIFLVIVVVFFLVTLGIGIRLPAPDEAMR